MTWHNITQHTTTQHNTTVFAVFMVLRLCSINYISIACYCMTFLVITIHFTMCHIFCRCVADGFIPEAPLKMTFDGKTIDIRQTVIKHLEESANHPFYNYHVFRSVAVTEGVLEMQVEDSGIPLKCRASVRDTGAVVETMVRPVLKCKITAQIILTLLWLTTIN